MNEERFPEHDVLIRIPESDRELLRECEVETFRSSGKGGQHVNKTETAVRLRHLPTGIVVTAQDERSQYRNKLLCLQRLRKKLEVKNRRRKKRIATAKSRRVKVVERESKVRHAAKKRLRKPPEME